MKDGIDHQAYRQRLRTADPVQRKHAARELGAWLRSAALASGREAKWGLVFLALGVGLTVLSFRFDPTRRSLLVIAGVMILGGQWLSWIGNKRARQWRRAHPFDEWRAAQSIDQ